MTDLGIEGLEDAVLVGRGGFGVVYRARQTLLNRVVAVKVLSTVLDGAALERFEREGFAMGTVAGHPNIVQILGHGTTQAGRPYLLMPYVVGGSFDALLPLAWPEALKHAVRLCGALATAHEAGVLHRDLKPANVLLSEFGEPLLADFGIARVIGGFETSTGLVTASIPFAAPEILEGSPASVPADVYSLAATVHCLISGTPPFAPRSGEEVVSTYLRISREPPPDLRELGVPDAVCHALETAMAKAPVDRPASAAEFGRLLQDAQRRTGLAATSMALAAGPETSDPDVTVATSAASTPTIKVSPTSPPPAPTRRPSLLPLGALVLVLLVASIGGYLLWPDGDGGGTTGVRDEVTYPTGLAVAPDGSVYVSDRDRHRVVLISPEGDAEVVAGTGSLGNSGDGGRASEAGLEFPSSVALASSGELYVATGGIVRRIDEDGAIGPVTGFPKDFAPIWLAAGDDGTLYAASRERVLVRDRTGHVTERVNAGDAGTIGGIALHPDGWLAVSDAAGNQIIRVTSRGKVRRIAGLGTSAGDPKGDGLPALESAASVPTGLAFDEAGRLYFSESGANRVRVLELDGTLRTLAGSPDGYSTGNSGDGGPGRSATFGLMDGPLAVDSAGNVYIGDVGNERVRRLDTDGNVHAFA